MRRAGLLRSALLLAAAAYSSTSGVAEGNIIAVIITAHIAQSSTTCGVSQVLVIIHADAPRMVPYMSRAITAIHAHAASGMTTSTTTMTMRSCRSAASRRVGAAAPFGLPFTILSGCRMVSDTGGMHTCRCLTPSDTGHQTPGNAWRRCLTPSDTGQPHTGECVPRVSDTIRHRTAATPVNDEDCRA